MKRGIMVMVVAAALLSGLGTGCPKTTAPAKDKPPSPAASAPGSNAPSPLPPPPPPPVSPPSSVSVPPPASPPASPPGEVNPAEFSWNPPGSGPVAEETSSERPAAPDFTLTGLDGKKYQLSAYRSKVVVLCFWSLNCPHCLFTVPTLDRLAQKVNPKSVVILAVIEAPPEAVKARVRELNLKIPVLLDPGNKVSLQYAVEYVPTTFIIAPDGTIDLKEVGARDWAETEAVAHINQLAAGVK